MLRASRDEAMTDALTGLGNRRALARDLEERCSRRPATRAPLVLALFDLDGFKHYNDTFGHPAGDALLVRLGRNLAACLARPRPRVPDGRRRVLRAVRARATSAEQLVARAAARALRARRGLHDRLLLRRRSCSPREATDAAEALRIADQRMYAQKHAGPHVGRRARARTCCCAR